jgi:hypothetical protein
VSEPFASSIGRSEPHAVTFQVSDAFLDAAHREDWSDPVQFRFELRDDGRYDLVMRRVEA